LGVDDRSEVFFSISQGTLPWQPIMLRKYYQRRLLLLAFVALVLENELQYYDLAVRTNSGDDGAISSKNLVNFCPLTSELTGLICEPQVRRGQKTGVFC